MMRRIVILTLFFFSPSLHAEPQPLDDLYLRGRMMLFNLEKVIDHIEYLFTKDLIKDPAEVLAIVDIDGVMTNQNHPPVPYVKPEHRKFSVELIKYFQSKKIPMIAATAWDVPAEGAKRLIDLGFGDAFNVHSEKTEVAKSEKVRVNRWREVEADLATNGNLISVRLPEDSRFFFSKAFTPYVLYGFERTNQFKYIFFLDDSDYNIQHFIRLRADYALFIGAGDRVATIHVSREHRDY